MSKFTRPHNAASRWREAAGRSRARRTPLCFLFRTACLTIPIRRIAIQERFHYDPAEAAKYFSQKQGTITGEDKLIKKSHKNDKTTDYFKKQFSL
jgi:hypothetical protein